MNTVCCRFRVIITAGMQKIYPPFNVSVDMHDVCVVPLGSV